MIMVDTDILIWILRGNQEIINLFEEKTKETNGFIFITPIQIAEIFAGLRTNEKIQTELFLDTLNIIPIDKNIGKLSGEFIQKYKKSDNVTFADSIIASATILNNLKLWTLNKKHYPMITDFVN